MDISVYTVIAAEILWKCGYNDFTTSGIFGTVRARAFIFWEVKERVWKPQDLLITPFSPKVDISTCCTKGSIRSNNDLKIVCQINCASLCHGIILLIHPIYTELWAWKFLSLSLLWVIKIFYSKNTLNQTKFLKFKIQVLLMVIKQPLSITFHHRMV